jgi:GH25 family lysozyme M1 (1,4-beta-N-acetylmuramidase)
MKKISILFIFIPFWILGQTVLGIDVSHHQGSINWSLVAYDGKVFAYVKATEGFTWDDPRFVTNMNNGVNAGVKMGAYHFARPDNNSAIDEANHFVSVAGNYIGNGFLPPALDLENPNSSTHLDQLFTSTQLTNWVQAWMDRVEALTGVRPIIYLNSYFANYLQPSLNTYGLWIAKPGTSPTSPPNDIGNWNDWLIKQYSWQGNVSGISGNVDLNSFHGSVSDFNDLVRVIQIDKKQVFKLYPNPVKTVLYLHNLTSDKAAKIEVFDTNGRLINEFKPVNQIDLSYLNEGLYLIKITTTSEAIFTFIITKS